jgi:hypothetical protein
MGYAGGPRVNTEDSGSVSWGSSPCSPVDVSSLTTRIYEKRWHRRLERCHQICHLREPRWSNLRNQLRGPLAGTLRTTHCSPSEATMLPHR